MRSSREARLGQALVTVGSVLSVVALLDAYNNPPTCTARAVGTTCEASPFRGRQIGLALGVALGLAAGYYGRRTDDLVILQDATFDQDGTLIADSFGLASRRDTEERRARCYEVLERHWHRQ